MNTYSLKNEEKIIFALRELYGSHGYSRYKMSKFEEYDLYVRNKDFLISDSVITFTDTNGKLMALKPDVTLSIVKNSRDIPGCVQKLYYNENVYRVSGGTHSFREIMQVGLECIGEIDDFSILEVLKLAAESMKRISESCVLNVSHLGILSELMADIPAADAERILSCMRDKNLHELRHICKSAGISDDRSELLQSLASIHGAPASVLPKLKKLLGSSAALTQLEALMDAFVSDAIRDMLRIDFSVISDANYYNGIVFKGFVEGVPTAVLSGGQYDRLMRRMSRKSDAIGFAVYLDHLERLNGNEKKYDVDVVLLYDAAADLSGLQSAAEAIRAQGMSVTAQRIKPEKLRCRQVVKYSGGKVEILEEFA